jgi:thioredoxin-like negative regulator of GroEL
MVYRIVCFLASGLALWLGAEVARAESAAETFARGQTQLQAGDLEGALKAFSAAAADQQDNSEYKAKAETLGKVIALRGRLEKEEDTAQWTRIARALHTYYRQERLHDEALKLDRRIFGKLQSGLSASLLADTLLATGKNMDAAMLLASLPEEKQDLGTKVMRVIALARAGRKAEALAAAQKVPAPQELCPGKAYMLARMNAAVGLNAEAAKLLTTAFAAAPAARLAAFKETARQCPEFAVLAKEAEYAAVFATQSKGDHEKHEHTGTENRGHCMNCPSQDRVQDIAADGKPASDKPGSDSEKK